MGGEHLLESGQLASQIALSMELLLQIDTGQIVHQVVVIVLAALAGLDHVADGAGNLGLQLEGFLQSSGTIVPLLFSNSLRVG